MNRLALIDSIRHFLAEDIGSGDLTSESIFSDDQSGHARFIARAAFISAGMGQVAGEVFRLCNGAMVCTAMADGARVKAGEVLFTAAGPVIDLLRAERVALNLVQRLCGIATLTDTLLFFLPWNLTHSEGGAGPMHWYWSLVALLLGVFLIGLLGGMARYYIGKKLIQLTDHLLLQVPFLNRVYSTVKQVKEAFAASGKSAFKQVVLIEFPRPGLYSIAFITGEHHPEVEAKTGAKVVSVFVPTTPNPTSGFLVLVAEDHLTKLDMPVADAIKLIISLGAVTADFPAGGAPVIAGHAISQPAAVGSEAAPPSHAPPGK